MPTSPLRRQILCSLLALSPCLAAPVNYWRCEGNSGDIASTAENTVGGGPALVQEDGQRQPVLTSECPKLPGGTENKTAAEFRQDNRTALAATDPKVGDFEAGQAFTIECWIKPRAYPTKDDIFLTALHKRGNNPEGSQKPGYQLLLGADQHMIFGANAIDGGAKALRSQSPIPLDTWTHLAITRDAAGKLIFYVNGVKEDESRGPLPTSMANDGLLTVGANRFMMAKPPFWDGLIDEVRISDTALEPGELLYNAQ